MMASVRDFTKGLLIGASAGVFIGHFFGLFGLAKGVTWAHFAAAFPWWLPPVLGLFGGVHYVLLPHPAYREGLRQLGLALRVVGEILQAMAVGISILFWFK